MPAAVLPHRFEVRSVADMAPHPANARRGDVLALRESMDGLGFYGVVVVQQSTGHLLVGNHRWEAAVAEGITELPTIVLDVDDAVAERILIGDNRYADMATWDEEQLVAQLSRLAADDMGLIGTGYTSDDLTKMVADEDTSPQLGSITYMVLIEADDEAHQQELLEQLLSTGLRARPIMG